MTSVTPELRREGFSVADIEVLGTTMRYWSSGSGRPIVFLHGNPTSSYLWRNVLGPLRSSGRRLIALDLIGMGGSGKPQIDYRLSDHVNHVEAFVAALDLPPVTFVAHDWGVAIAFAYASRHPAGVQALAFMEGHLRPLPDWNAFDDGGRELFQRFRTPDVGERLVLDENFFLETLLPAGVLGGLDDSDLDEYRAPYPTPRSRFPLLAWARQVPIAGDPADVADLLPTIVEATAAIPIPKLLVRGEPGAIIGPVESQWLQQQLPGLAVAIVGPAGHFLPEDQPDALATVLAGWLDATEGVRG